jgi:hypothetical protein
LRASVRYARGIASLGVECLALLLVLHAPVAAAQLTLTWASAVGAAQYLVEREDISLGLFAEIARLGADATSYADTAVLAGNTYCYRLRAAAAAGYSDYSNVACGAAAAGVGSFFDDFSRPDARVLGNGWTTVAGTLMIQSGQARSAQVRMMHTAVQAGLSGAAQTISASFISVDNNLGPRFALLVRYKDPRNYYMCYRQTGGSSVLRISRVVGGVETVLSSYPLSNPVRGLLFTLGCQVQGATLTLTLGNVKFAVSDATFSSGSVGMSVGYPVAGTSRASSHIADNFKATVQ